MSDFGVPPAPPVPETAAAPVVLPPFASWGRRVGGYLLDGLIVSVVFGIPAVIGVVLFASQLDWSALDAVMSDPSATDQQVREVWEDQLTNADWTGAVIVFLALLLGFAFGIWNMIVRVGRTGQSLGKQIVGITVVRLDGTAPGGRGGIGQGLAWGRYLIQVLFGAISPLQLIDLLWPLWDDRNQTLHDKVVSTVVLRTP